MTASFSALEWRPPAHWLRITTLDMHTGGEPLRVITGGLPAIEGSSVLEKRRYFREQLDYVRTGLMWEPRGHADMYGAVVTPSSDADFDVFFLHNEGYSTMCGHAIIALTTLAAEQGLVQPKAEGGDAAEVRVSFNVPAGRIEAQCRLEQGRARDVSFRNVASFAYALNREVEVPGLGRLRLDIGYGGAFYALVDAGQLDLDLVPEQFGRIIDCGRRIKHAVMEAIPIHHPLEPELSFLYGTIFTGPARESRHHSRNVCIFAEGELDRSPTGSGVSARVAVHHAKGEVGLKTKITIESILGSTMSVRAVERTTLGPHSAVIPEVGGTACITGRHEFIFDPDDPFTRGFIFR